MSKISCLHLSDIHIGKSMTTSVDDFYSTICRDLKSQNQKIDIVICSGDIFFGKEHDKNSLIKRAIEFFNNLMDRINTEELFNKNELTKNEFIFVPGNHDVDRSSSNLFHYYDEFLNKFYTRKLKNNIYNTDYFFTTKVFEEEKVAFVGLNSCMVEKCITRQETEWINNLDFSSISLLNKHKEKEVKEVLLKSKTRFDDYGEISVKQLLAAFDKLKKEIEINSYKIVSFFHHHIYPFPEIYDKYGDSSMIRNFPNVINSLMDNNVKIVLHGHKHIPVSRLITTNKYFENPENGMYVFSTGTLENIDGQRAFQVLDIYSPDQMIEAEVFKYSYSGEELQKRDEICIPPKYNLKNKSIGEFKTKLRQKNLELYEEYKNEIEDRDNVSTRYGILNLITNLENTLLNFDGINQDLNRQPEIIFNLLSIIHYRIVALDSNNNGTNNQHVLELIKKSLSKNINNSEYLDKIIEILASEKSSEFNTKIKTLFENIQFNKYRKTTAYLSVISLFTDLFLSISPYGEMYFKKEGLEHKINIKLGTGELNTNIPNSSIKIIGEEDRRCATISFICKNPTAHKIGVLIVKDFEERITKIEEAFKELNLKLYYIRPKVEKVGYELDNYNFEAYIPTLLPLLTGDNLYSQKEVFIRELIQNSYDAIKLREQIDSSDFDKNIYIEIGTEKRENGEKGRFLKIKDSGIGMDLYKIERYFTSIGRSFYTSDDFAELQREKNIQYKAVSNFGIGFLSVFMVCKEVKVKTKSLFTKGGIEIHIPNYEGCFFINKDEYLSEIGTEIIIYQDERRLINTTKILKYIQENFLDFDLNIQVKYPKKLRKTEANRLKKELPEFSLYVPFENNNSTYISAEDVISKRFIDKYKYGCAVNFDTREKPLLLNSGIKVNSKSNRIKVPIEENTLGSISYNYPSSNINLDVSRDKILNLKIEDIDKFNSSIKQNLAKQASELISLIEKKYPNKSLSFINQLTDFGYFLNKKNDFLEKSYSMIIKEKGSEFVFIPCKQNKLKSIEKDKDLIIALNTDGTYFIGNLFEKVFKRPFKKAKSSRYKEPNDEYHFMFAKRHFYFNSFEPSSKETLQKILNIELTKIIKRSIKHYNTSIEVENEIQLFEEHELVQKSLFESEKEVFEKDMLRRKYYGGRNFDLVDYIFSSIYPLFLKSHNIEDVQLK